MQDIKLILHYYLHFIEHFRKCLLHHTGNSFFDFNVETGRAGQVEDYTYLFHGAGCRVEKDGIVCEFDFLPKNEYPIKFSLWKFQEYIRTSKQWEHAYVELSELHVALMKLVESNDLHLLEIAGCTYLVFQVADVHIFDRYPSLQPNESKLRGGIKANKTTVSFDEISERIVYLVTHRLTAIATDQSGWFRLYQDPTDLRYWQLSYPDSELHGGGAPMLENIAEAMAQNKYKY